MQKRIFFTEKTIEYNKFGGEDKGVDSWFFISVKMDINHSREDSVLQSVLFSNRASNGKKIMAPTKRGDHVNL